MIEILRATGTYYAYRSHLEYPECYLHASGEWVNRVSDDIYFKSEKQIKTLLEKMSMSDSYLIKQPEYSTVYALYHNARHIDSYNTKDEAQKALIEYLSRPEQQLLYALGFYVKSIPVGLDRVMSSTFQKAWDGAKWNTETAKLYAPGVEVPFKAYNDVQVVKYRDGTYGLFINGELKQKFASWTRSFPVLPFDLPEKEPAPLPVTPR